MNDTIVDESMSLTEHEQTYVHPESPAPTATEPAPVPEPVPEPEPAADEPAAESKPERPDAGRERDEHGRWKPKEKHRPKSQYAAASDVEKINEYTKRLREAEDALGVKIEKQPGESERVYQLRRRAELAEIRRDIRQSGQRQQAPVVAIPPPPKEFTDQEPKYEDFANEPDQYAAWLRATTAYDRRKEGYEQQKTAHDTAQEAEIKARNAARDEWFKTKHEAHSARMEQLFTTNPQAEKIIADADVLMTPVMIAALLASENSDQIALRLAQDQELADDLVALTDGKPPSRDFVAIVQRRMNRGLQVVKTGSTAPAPVVTAPPRPPNPVRTGVMKAADTPPGDDSSLSEHERAYGTVRRRR